MGIRQRLTRGVKDELPHYAVGWVVRQVSANLVVTRLPVALAPPSYDGKG